MRILAQRPGETCSTHSERSSTLGRIGPGLSRGPGTRGVRATPDVAAVRGPGSRGTGASSFGHDIGRIRIGPSLVGTMQRKLAVNTPGDEYEQEADRVAEQVMRMPAPSRQWPCRGCEEGGGLALRARAAQGVRRQRTGGDAPVEAPPIVGDLVSGSGRPLDPSVRSFMEARFGHDFSRVQIHTGDRAAESARAVHAKAYTVGRHVVFGAGAYRPDSDTGRRLIAHELTHVVQQDGGDASIRAAAQNEFGDSTLPIAPGLPVHATHDLRVQRQEDCYCCVSSVAITNVSRIDNATHMGHSFDFVVEMTRTTEHGPRLEPECTLEWWERTNVPYTAGMAADTWTDMFQLVPTSPTFDPWRNRSTDCDTSATVTINDPPALGKRPGRTVTRTLEFDLKVKSGPGGTCAHSQKSATATQVLTMVNGAPDWDNSSFT